MYKDWRRISKELIAELMDRIEADHSSCELTTDDCPDAQYGENPNDHKRWRELNQLMEEIRK